MRIFDILNNYIIFDFSYKFTEEELEEFYPEGKMWFYLVTTIL